MTNHYETPYYVHVRTDQHHNSNGNHLCPTRAYAWRMASTLVADLRGTTGCVTVRDSKRQVIHRWACSDPTKPYRRERHH